MVEQKLAPRKDWQEEQELLVLGFFEKEGQPSGSRLGNRIFSNLAAGQSNLQKDFQGKFGQKSLVYKVKPRRILFVGLGKEKDFDFQLHREIAGQVACYVRDLGIKSFTTEVFPEATDPLKRVTPQRVKIQTEGQGIGLYRFDAYKKFDSEIEEIRILADETPEIKKAFEEGLTLVKAVCLTRNLINEPANAMTPLKLAAATLNIFSPFLMKTRVKIFREDELKELKMNLILAVGQGSKNEPCLIELEHKPENHLNEKPYVLVGKGVCFDSGGLQIKSADTMPGMHSDMAGGAVVIGTLKTVAELNLPLWIVGLVPAVENLVSESSYKPGDIIKAYNGKTIEIGHTDAEGRLIMFDTLAFAKAQYGPHLIIDIATLTGAIRIALGEHYAGLFGNSREFLEKIKKAGEESGDRVWEMPLGPKYLREMESKVADLKNVGSRLGGAITAACFLQEAVGEEQPWLHLDIAGAARIDVVGQASGFGVRLFFQFFLNQIRGH